MILVTVFLSRPGLRRRGAGAADAHRGEFWRRDRLAAGNTI